MCDRRGRRRPIRGSGPDAAAAGEPASPRPLPVDHLRFRQRGTRRGSDGAARGSLGVDVAIEKARGARSLGEREGGMITVPAMRLRQFGVTLYQAILGARDVDRLVRFEVLSYDDGRPAAPKGKRKGRPSRVNWELLEKRIAESSEAYQRPVIRKKIT